MIKETFLHISEKKKLYIINTNVPLSIMTCSECKTKVSPPKELRAHHVIYISIGTA